MDERAKFVLVDDGGRNDGDGDAHVFVLRHWGFEVKILEVCCHESCVRRRHDAVEDYFDGAEVGGFGAHVAVVCDAIAADGESDATRVCFLGTEGGNDAKVRCFFAAWDGGDRDEEHCVGAGGHGCAVSLAQSTEFVLA
jgi:hypothetical protein